jgi:hypothetical protein
MVLWKQWGFIVVIDRSAPSCTLGRDPRNKATAARGREAGEQGAGLLGNLPSLQSSLSITKGPIDNVIPNGLAVMRRWQRRRKIDWRATRR